jgi:dTDP-4-amino-4,6-dideoxygalactose transaminase
MEAGSFSYLTDIGDDLQMDLTALENDMPFIKLASNCKSMVVVQALGFVCDYKKYEAFAQKHGLKLIFDSAALLGASYEPGKKVGLAGDCEVFSLHITKTFGIGEGALVTSKDKKFLDTCRQIINFGFNKNGESEMYGTNAKCSEFHAAVGLAVLDNVDVSMGLKLCASGYYNHLFKGLPVKTLHQNSAFQVHPLIFETKEIRDKVKEALHQNNIGSRVYYIPVHRQPYFDNGTFVPGKFTKTEYYADRILCIPLFETITPEEQELVAKIIKENIS